MLHNIPLGMLATLRAYGIANAALFDGSTGFLSKTWGAAPTNGKKWTLSCWVQLGNLSSAWRAIIGSASDSDRMYVVFDDTDYAFIQTQDAVNLRFSPKYRDPTAMIHVVVVYDTAQATAANRLTLYMNGVEIADTLLTNYPAQNHESGINKNGNTNGLFNINPALNNHFDGYGAEFRMIDGQALTPSDFGELDLATGNWKAKAYTGTYGANGFHLDFSNGANLGEDSSGNGNDWTVNGTVTQVTSTPTNVYATLNPLDKHANIALSNGNRTVAATSTADYFAVRHSMQLIDGAYWECKIDVINTVQYLGISSPLRTLTAGINQGAGLEYMMSWAQAGGCGYQDGATSSSWSGAPNFAVNDLVAMYYKSNKLWFGRIPSGSTTITWINSAGTADPDTETDPRFSGIPDGYLGMHITPRVANQTYNFAEADWVGVTNRPSAAVSLCTNNLPARSPKTPTTPQTGSFTGNLNADGPFLNLGMVPDKTGTSTINGNTITWGTHADACATGVKIRTASTSYNASGTNTYSIAVAAYTGGSNVAEANAQGNP